jgi:hypothetical protein
MVPTRRVHKKGLVWQSDGIKTQLFIGMGTGILAKIANGDEATLLNALYERKIPRIYYFRTLK